MIECPQEGHERKAKMSNGKFSDIQGLLLANGASEVLFCNGVAGDPRLKALAADRVWMAEARRHRLNSLTLDRKTYTVLVMPFEDGDLLILSNPPGEAVTNFLGSVDFAWDLMQHLLTDPFEGMIIVDDHAKIAYISAVHEKFFGLKQGEARGRPVEEIVDGTRLHHVVKTGKAEIGTLQRMRGSDRIVSRIPVKRGEQILGAFGRVMFKGPEQVAALNARIKALEGEVEFYKRESATLKSHAYGLERIIGESTATRRLRAEIVKVAPLEIPVLIRGESGTGKELVAQALHRLSPRRDAPMVNVNAAALPAALVESELFGYEAGAFTGADRKGRKGKFEQAHGGTIFLDEIGDMPLEVQAKLLRVLQDRMVERVGGEKPREIDFRLVSATNKDLQSLVEESKFRLDLFYRISPIVIRLPPLRERIDDIPLLVSKFLQEIAYRHARPEPGISAAALALLSERPWPGNIRQLQHEVERAFVFSDGATIEAHDLSEAPVWDAAPVAKVEQSVDLAKDTLRTVISEVEKEGIKEALTRFKGNKKKAAESLGISRSYLYKKLAVMNDGK
jgi:transcriptional regulator with PAS, ATPase and Fis domain